MTRNNELRKVRCQFNPLSHPDGSAMFAQGATVVIAAMVGPVEVKLQNLSIENSFLESYFRPKSGQPTTKDRIRESTIKDICELALITDMHPRTKMSIQVQELEDRGGLEACSINAACMALLIGGLPLNFTFAAIHCIVNEERKLILDPDLSEMKHSCATFTFVYDSVEGNILSIQTKGSFKIEEFNEAERISRTASKEMFEFYRSCVGKFIKKSLEVKKIEIEEDGDEPMDV